MKAEHQGIIDQALLDIAYHESERANALGMPAHNKVLIDELRQSKLGQWLYQLVEIIDSGLDSAKITEARTTLDKVYKLLFQAPGQSYPIVPAKFDKTPLGNLLNEARIHTLGVSDIVNVAEAAKLTQIQRAQVYYLIIGGVLHPLEINGKVMIERRELGRIEEYKKQEKP